MTDPVTADDRTMRAVVGRRYGSPDVLALEQVERPAVGAAQVLVEVHAAGVDRGVVHLVSGSPYLVRLAGYGLTRPRQPVPGLDLSGRVVAVGADVTRVAVGDEVLGIGSGTFAEYAVAEESKLVARPAGLSRAEAAALSISGTTALQALTDVGGVEAGQRVLILGASGGVGSFAVQLARAAGAEVTGVASAAKADLVRRLGAHHVIDYETTDATSGEHRYDLVLDIGGRTPVRKLRRALAPRGTLVIVGGEDGGPITGGVGRQLRAVLLSPFVRQRLTTFVSSEDGEHLERLVSHVERGEVRPVVERTYGLDEAPQALADIDAGRARGKAVVVVRPG